jgi:hypothetical protein
MFGPDQVGVADKVTLLVEIACLRICRAGQGQRTDGAGQRFGHHLHYLTPPVSTINMRGTDGRLPPGFASVHRRTPADVDPGCGGFCSMRRVFL